MARAVVTVDVDNKLPPVVQATVKTEIAKDFTPRADPTLGGGFQSGAVRRAVQNITCAIASATTFQSNAAAWRHALGVPVPTTRVRFRVANRWGSGVGAASAVVSGIWMGTAALSTAEGAPTGQMSAAPTKMADGFTLATDGTDYLTPWVTIALDPSLLYLVSYGLTTGAGAYAQHQTEGWFEAGIGNAGVQNLTAPQAAAFGCLDIRMEYEFDGAYPSGLWLTASIGGAYQTEGQVIRQCFPQLYGRTRRHAISQSPVISSTLADYEATPATNWRWQRLQPSTLNLDYAVIGEMAVNSISAGASLAAMKVSFGNIAAYLKTLGIKRIYGVLPSPVNNVSGKLTAAKAAASTSLTADVNPGGGFIGLGSGTNFEIVQQTAAATGSGPYTVPVAATAKAHVVGDRIMSQQETTRYAFIQWLQTLPFGLTAVFDFDAAVRQQSAPAVLDPDVAEADQLHVRARGQARMMAAIPATI